MTGLIYWIAIAMLVFVPVTASADNELNVVLNNSVQLQGLSRYEIREIFSSRRQYWQDGSKITVFVLEADSTLHQRFCRQVLQLFPYQLDRSWNLVAYSGQGDRPQTVRSEDELLSAVKKTPGAIGYSLKAENEPGLTKVVIQ